ncbi:hypothetical protein HMPREF1554_00560 [Porphyromonas gingivalis F0569]|nr:hypothetical protein HMPREF1554_00560 [Porphyromonas gingivalis F0569]
MQNFWFIILPKVQTFPCNRLFSGKFTVISIPPENLSTEKKSPLYH